MCQAKGSKLFKKVSLAIAPLKLLEEFKVPPHVFFRSHEKHDFEKNVFKVGEQKIFDIYSTNGLNEI